MYFQSSVGQVLWSHHFFHLQHVYNNQGFSNCSSTMDVGFVKLLSDSFLWKWSSRWISSSAVTFAAVLLWFIDTILFNVWRRRWWLFPHQRCYTGHVCHEINRCTVTLYCRNCSPWLWQTHNRMSHTMTFVNTCEFLPTPSLHTFLCNLVGQFNVSVFSGNGMFIHSGQHMPVYPDCCLSSKYVLP